MKNINFLMLFALISSIAFIYSCGNKLEDENKRNLIGSWAAYEYSKEGCANAANDSTQELTCTEQNCIRYIFDIIDSTKQQIYIKERTTSGVVESEVGRFSVGENDITFCQSNDGVQTCQKASLDVSSTNLIIGQQIGDSECKEVYSFTKETEDQS